MGRFGAFSGKCRPRSSVPRKASRSMASALACMISMFFGVAGSSEKTRFRRPPTWRSRKRRLVRRSILTFAAMRSFAEQRLHLRPEEDRPTGEAGEVDTFAEDSSTHEVPDGFRFVGYPFRKLGDGEVLLKRERLRSWRSDRSGRHGNSLYRSRREGGGEMGSSVAVEVSRWRAWVSGISDD